jgi:methyl-accepting chemotaxis protein
MNWNLRLGGRILLGFGASLVVVGAAGIIAYRALGEVGESADLVTHTYKVLETLAQTVSTITEAEAGQRGYLLTGEERYLDQFQVAARQLVRPLEDLRELTKDNRNQQRRLDTLQPLVASKISELQQTITARKEKGERAAAELARTDKGKIATDDVRRAVAEMQNEENELLKERDATTKATARFAAGALLIGGLVIVALKIVLALLTKRSITVPLTGFMQFVARVGDGDLTHHAKISTNDELGDLAKGLDQMVTGLKEVATQARLASDNLNSAAAEILASTQQQAAGSNEQAAAIQQTTTTMEEVTQSGVQISERAKQVAATAEATSAASHTGLQAVEITSRTMETIREQAEAVAENVVSLSERTQAIGEIIATVNDLAEQSHLLALNAAIEAAAAGEHGRSFSVIASEVKNLADQSREATVQVRSILGDIQKGINTSVMLTEEAVKRVDTGRQHADVADRTIREMTESIQLSVQAFQQIVAGANQQQVGFAQVMQAIRDIGQASQQSAASTQQLEKAAVNLTALGQQLETAVARYRM